MGRSIKRAQPRGPRNVELHPRAREVRGIITEYVESAAGEPLRILVPLEVQIEKLVVFKEDEGEGELSIKIEKQTGVTQEITGLTLKKGMNHLVNDYNMFELAPLDRTSIFYLKGKGPIWLSLIWKGI